MKRQLHTYQQGRSAFGMLMTLVIVAVLVVGGMRLVPVCLEYQTLNRVARVAASAQTENEIRNRFDSQLRLDGLTNSPVKGRDIRVRNPGSSRATVYFSYDVVIPIIGDYSHTLHFNVEQTEGTQR